MVVITLAFKASECRLSRSSILSLYCGGSIASASISLREISFPFDFGFLPLSAKFAARHSPWKHAPGCKIVRARQAMQTIAPSRIMKLTWLFAKGPWKPPDSSATRKTDRMKIAAVAMQSPTKKERKRRLLGRLLLRGWLDMGQNCLLGRDLGVGKRT